MIDPPIDEIGLIPKCNIYNMFSSNCITIGYAISGPNATWVDEVMADVKINNKFSDDDVQLIVQKPFIFNDTNKYLLDNTGHVMIAV